MIHSTAVIDPSAEIAPDVKIGPYSIIGPGVKIGSGSILHSHVIIQANTHLGTENEIFPYTVLGTPPQDTKYRGEPCFLKIGSHNIIREHVSIHISNSPEDTTVIGDHNFIMGNAHIAHNCRLGNHNTLTQGAALSGHVTMEDHVILGGQAGIHQFVRIGRFSMVGGQAGVVQDVPPFGTFIGTPAFYIGINEKGLTRMNFSKETIANIGLALEILFRRSASTEGAIAQIQDQCGAEDEIDHLINFLRESKRGICN